MRKISALGYFDVAFNPINRWPTGGTTLDYTRGGCFEIPDVQDRPAIVSADAAYNAKCWKNIKVEIQKEVPDYATLKHYLSQLEA